jgi:hypothetical protein
MHLPTFASGSNQISSLTAFVCDSRMVLVLEKVKIKGHFGYRGPMAFKVIELSHPTIERELNR